MMLLSSMYGLVINWDTLLISHHYIIISQCIELRRYPLIHPDNQYSLKLNYWGLLLVLGIGRLTLLDTTGVNFIFSIELSMIR